MFDHLRKSRKKSIFYILRDVAQLVARVLWEHDVAGSNPVIPTKKHGDLSVSVFFALGDRLCTCDNLRAKQAPRALGSKSKNNLKMLFLTKRNHPEQGVEGGSRSTDARRLCEGGGAKPRCQRRSSPRIESCHSDQAKATES